MNRFLLCTLAIVFSACIAASAPIPDIATFKAAGFNVTRNLEGKKEKMVRDTTAVITILTFETPLELDQVEYADATWNCDGEYPPCPGCK